MVIASVGLLDKLLDFQFSANNVLAAINRFNISFVFPSLLSSF